MDILVENYCKTVKMWLTFLNLAFPVVVLSEDNLGWLRLCGVPWVPLGGHAPHHQHRHLHHHARLQTTKIIMAQATATTWMLTWNQPVRQRAARVWYSIMSFTHYDADYMYSTAGVIQRISSLTRVLETLAQTRLWFRVLNEPKPYCQSSKIRHLRYFQNSVDLHLGVYMLALQGVG